MDRRSFLKILGATAGFLVAAPAALVAAISPKKDFLKGMKSVVREVDSSGYFYAPWKTVYFDRSYTPLDRVSIRRISVYIKRNITKFMECIQFEKNDELTRNTLMDFTQELMDNLKVRGGIYDYLIVCDKTNNPPDRELTLDVYYKKNYSAEYIWLKFWL